MEDIQIAKNIIKTTKTNLERIEKTINLIEGLTAFLLGFMDGIEAREEERKVKLKDKFKILGGEND